jgi:hypothetical protein
MDGETAEKLYQAAEDSLRASLAAWGAAFDAAQATKTDRVRWIVEEAAWTANRRANVVRNIAWELADQVLTSTREQVRQQLLSAMQQQQQPMPAPPPVQQTPAPPQQSPAAAFGTQGVVRLPTPGDGNSA